VDHAKHENIRKVFKWKVSSPPAHSSESLGTWGRASPGMFLAG